MFNTQKVIAVDCGRATVKYVDDYKLPLTFKSLYHSIDLSRILSMPSLINKNPLIVSYNDETYAVGDFALYFQDSVASMVDEEFINQSVLYYLVAIAMCTTPGEEIVLGLNLTFNTYRYKDQLRDKLQGKHNIGIYDFDKNKWIRKEFIIGKVGVVHQGWCISGESYLVTKEYGVCKIKNIEDSSLVTIWDGDRYVNAQVKYTGKKLKVIVKFQGGSILECSLEHKLLCVTDRGKKSWRTVESLIEINKTRSRTKVRFTEECGDWSLKSGDRFVESVKSVSSPWNFKDISFRNIKDDFSLGLVLGRLKSDGSVSDHNLRWFVAEHEYNIYSVLRDILLSLGHLGEVVLQKPNRKPIKEITVSSKSLAEEYRKLDIANGIPDTILNSREMLRGFLRGIFDGDGGVSRSGICLSFGKDQFYKRYSEDIQRALMLFGVRSRIYFGCKKIVVRVLQGDSSLFKERIGFINSIKSDKIYISLKNKFSSGKSVIIKSIELTDSVIDMYDVVNSDSSKFMCNGVVVHNSALVAIVLDRKKQLKPEFKEYLGQEGLILDVGRRTIDIIVVRNMSPVDGATYDYGTYTVYNEVASALRRKYSLNKPVYDIEDRHIRRVPIHLPTGGIVDVASLVEQHAQVVAKRTLENLKEYLYQQTPDYVYIVGGGSYLFSDIFRAYFANLKTVEYAEFLNVMGMYIFFAG